MNTITNQEVIYLCPVCENKGKKNACETCQGKGWVNLFDLVKFLISAGHLAKARHENRFLTSSTLLECPECKGKKILCNTCQGARRCRQFTAVSYLAEGNHRAVKIWQ